MIYTKILNHCYSRGAVERHLMFSWYYMHVCNIIFILQNKIRIRLGVYSEYPFIFVNRRTPNTNTGEHREVGTAGKDETVHWLKHNHMSCLQQLVNMQRTVVRENTLYHRIKPKPPSVKPPPGQIAPQAKNLKTILEIWTFLKNLKNYIRSF